MIPFFRRIRKQHADDNQVLKYARYAIGEIVLVVIGILIALQINNWNEERKSRIEEIEILKSIKLDFVNVIDECKENNEFRRKILASTNELYAVINNPSHGYSEVQLDSLMAVLFINPTYNNKTGSLDILFTSGKINSISQPEIKEALILWPQQIDDVSEDEIYASETLRYEFYPFIRKYVSIQKVNNQIQYKDLDLFDSSIRSDFESDYEGLLSDMEFEGLLATRELTLSVSLLQTNDLIETAEGIIELIEDKIQSKN
jgi:hypothetical protein